MRVVCMRIGGFGAFRDESLELAPGLTVIHGPNEAGKSTWHAALYAALCGMRRGRGASTLEDRRFAEQYRPWDGHPWSVSAEIVLADGRRIELRQDLDGRVDCGATDSLGRDVSAEIIFEGSPDASRWVGLDRRAFLATACVRQSEVLQVRENAAALQEHLQRAAATAGTDATAARALELIEEAIRMKVGREAINSVRPLRRAINAVAVAEERLTRVQQAHEEYIQLLGQAQDARAAAEVARRRVRKLEASQAESEASEWERQLARIEEILGKYPDGPPSAPKDEGMANAVAAALAAWDSRPAVPSLQGQSSVELRRALDELPPVPTGDLEPSSDVVRALAGLRAARAALAGHEASRPFEVVAPPVSLTPAELLEIAGRLDEPIPSRDEALLRGVEGLRQATLQPRSHNVAYALAAGAALLVLSAGAAIAAGIVAAAVAAGVGSLVLGLLAMVRLRGDSVAGPLAHLRAQETQLAQSEAAIASAENRRRAALGAVEAHNLPRSSDAVRALAGQVEQASRSRMLLAQWETQRTVLDQKVNVCTGQLANALAARGVSIGPGVDLETTAEQYQAECRQRAAQAHAASHRNEIEQQLATRLQLEESVLKARTAIDIARKRLDEVAGVFGIDVESGIDVIAELQTWRAAREENATARQAATGEWAEMQTILAGRDLEQFRAEVAERRERASSLARELGTATVHQDEGGARLPEERRRAQDAARVADILEGKLSTIEPSIVDVSAAEEQQSAAQAELARVRRLEAVLVKTKEHMEVAQDRVHRTIAPVLTATLRQWMPSVTGGRWTDAQVDPESLMVRVRPEGAEWREAALLSEGTREQIYLLLRMAMVKHLTQGSETCPLILDDVTVHSDSTRKRALLDLLLALTAERQIILFAQEPEVRAWAAETLGPPNHRLHQLPQPTPAIPASGEEELTRA